VGHLAGAGALQTAQQLAGFLSKNRRKTMRHPVCEMS
jgi:hypothetical protein